MEKKIELDMNNIPESIAIIMDGNGRWAKDCLARQEMLREWRR